MSKDVVKAAPAETIEVTHKADTIHRLYLLLDEAQKYATLVSPYIAIEKLRDFERKIRSALSRKVSVSLIIRSRDTSNQGLSLAGHEMLQGLMELGLRVYELQDLHAKIYLSERHAMVTSLNLLESSFNNSIEIGVWVPAQCAEYARIVDFVKQEIVPHRRPFPVLRPKPEPAPEPDEDDLFLGGDDEDEDEDESGCCIRCGTELDLDPSKPYCDDHYAIWARYGDPDYVDKYCHGCGDRYPATKNKPFCKDCFREHRDTFGL